MRYLPIFCLLLIMLGVSEASAADIEAASKIDAVTINPDGATVTRLASASFPAGSTTLLFRNLPPDLDVGSLRAGGEAEAALVIGSVDTRLDTPDGKQDSGIEARLKNLRSEREGWQVTLDALDAKKAMMLRFSAFGPEKIGPDTKPLAVADWQSAWDTVGAALAKVGDELRAARAKANALDDDIKTLEAARARPVAKATPVRTVSVLVTSATPAQGTIKLTYRVAGASWQPLYDADLDTGGAGRSPSLQFTRRATIGQRTGEDWTDVALVLSTVRAASGTAAPALDTQRLAFFEPPLATATPLMKQRSEDANKPAPMASAPVLRLASEAQTTLDAGAFQAAFTVTGRSSLAGDGAISTVSISARKLTPDLTIKTVPTLDTTAYLEGRILNDDAAPLLPGPVVLHRDGALVGNGRIGLVAPGDAFDLGFGADDRVKVVRIPVRRKENEPTWFGQTKTETREFKTTVRNLHDTPQKITVIDRVPISENTAIAIDVLATTTAPTDKSLGDKRGVMAWTADYAAGEAKDIRVGYRMKWPADREVTFETVR